MKKDKNLRKGSVIDKKILIRFFNFPKKIFFAIFRPKTCDRLWAAQQGAQLTVVGNFAAVADQKDGPLCS